MEGKRASIQDLCTERKRASVVAFAASLTRIVATVSWQRLTCESFGWRWSSDFLGWRCFGVVYPVEMGCFVKVRVFLKVPTRGSINLHRMLIGPADGPSRNAHRPILKFTSGIIGPYMFLSFKSA